MKKFLTLCTLALALSLAACAQPPTAPLPVTKIYVTATYTYTVKASETIVTVRPGKVGTKFCYTDRSQTTEVCNNLVTGTRTVASGYDQDVEFSEPDAVSSITLNR